MVEFSTSHLKFIKGKVNPIGVVRSSESTGRLLALYRLLHLKNNYCLYDSDRILYISRDENHSRDISLAYERIKDKSEFDCITLFSAMESDIDFLTMEEILESYFQQHNVRTMKPLRLIDFNEGRRVIDSCLGPLRNEYRGIKLLSGNYSKFLLEEINWMKSLDYNEAEKYQSCERRGRKYKRGEGPVRILKNSREREAIFRLYKLYEEKLHSNGLVDLEDRDAIALGEAERKRAREYTHIVVDESRSFKKKQLEIINLLQNERSYGEILYLYDGKADVTSNAFLMKPGRIAEIGGGKRIKSFYFRKPLDGDILSSLGVEREVEPSMNSNNNRNKLDISIESYEFINLRNKSEFKFIRDITRKDSIILIDEMNNQEVTPEEMKEIPMFSNIAAGSPIPMNPEVEDTFYLPSLWVRGSEEHFILKVRGDSMIGAGIKDGDHVVIKSTPVAQNRDIVAVNLDGSATLKRLVIKGSSAVLMPENPNYEPIPINEEGAHVIGIAVGIIREGENS